MENEKSEEENSKGDDWQQHDGRVLWKTALLSAFGLIAVPFGLFCGGVFAEVTLHPQAHAAGSGVYTGLMLAGTVVLLAAGCWSLTRLVTYH